MAADQDDKTEEATQTRIDDARKRGEIVYSSEVGAAFTLLGATALVAFIAGPMSLEIANALTSMIVHAGDYAADGRALMQLYMEIGLKVGGALMLTLLMFTLGSIATRFVQDQPAFSPDRLQPKLERLNPLEGAKRVFGAAAFSNFSKSALKLVVVGAAVVYTLWPRDGTLAMLPLLDVGAIGPYLKERALSLLFTCTIAVVILAGADYFFTRQAHLKRLRMTRTELKEEFRQSEGDPAIRAKLRQLRMERARNRMMAAVPQATVIITNPTHYAVALKYDKGEHAAPICVAKGVNDIALKIREVAGEHEVPIIEDPPLARALYATAELEQPIPREHFEAVAKVIGYVLKLAQKRRR